MSRAPRSPFPPEGERPVIRRRLAYLAILLIAAAAVRLATFRGLLAPVRIFGGSMAPALAGDHRQRACGDCGFPIRYDAGLAAEAARIVCPNCGREHPDPQKMPAVRGDRVLIDTLPYRIRKPRRREVVAVPDPERPQRLLVKRVVGLPGETIGVRRGELYVDGRLQQKTLPQLRDVAVLVHDQRYRPPESQDLPPRWAPAPGSRGWQADGDGFAYTPRPATGGHAPDWLEYTNWRCFANPFPRSQPFPVLDHLGYNQGISRQLNMVGDLLLSLRVRSEGNRGRVFLRIADGLQAWTVQLPFDGSNAVLFRDGTPVASESLPQLDFYRGVTVDVAVCDARLLLDVAGQSVLQWAFGPGQAEADDRARPLGIAAAGTRLHVDHLRVYRDLFYLDPQGLPRDWTMAAPLPEDSVFLLGDNPCVSRDSRHWTPPGVSLDHLLGRVVRW